MVESLARRRDRESVGICILVESAREKISFNVRQCGPGIGHLKSIFVIKAVEEGYCLLSEDRIQLQEGH